MIHAAGLWLALGAVAVLVGTAFVMGWQQESRAASPGVAVAIASAVFLVVLGAKLGCIARFASSHPFWDQWSEGGGLYRPYLEGRLPWSFLFEPHNEHRLSFTRLTALGLFDLNRQWDNRVQAVFNALLHSLMLGWLAAVIARRHELAEALIVGGVLALLAGIPFARENVTWGFQSWAYFYVLFAVLGLWLVPETRAFTTGWWVGLACVFACLFTGGPGPLCAAALTVGLLLECLRSPSRWPAHVPTLIVGALLAAAGLLLLPAVPRHQVYQAGTVREFLISLGRVAAFPWVDTPVLAPLVWTPFLLGLAKRIRWRRELPDGGRILTALGVFVLLHAPAIAYARGAGGAGPATRYFDILGLGVLVNLLAALALLHAARAGDRLRIGAGMLLWVALVAVGGVNLASRVMLVELPAAAEASLRQARRLATFLETGQREALAASVPSDLPAASADILAEMLEDPFVRSVMPASVRPALPLAQEDAAGSAFEPGGLPPGYAPEPGRPAFSSWPKFFTHRTGEFRSNVITTATLPYLRVEVTGYYITHRQALALVGAAQRVPVSLRAPAGGRWLARTVRRPAGPFRVVATDEQPDQWYAFRAPVEIGALSAGTEWLLERWHAPLEAGALLATFIVLWSALLPPVRP